MQMIRYVAVFFAICFFSSINGVFAAVTAVGSPATISTSTIGNDSLESINPDVAYDPTNNQYLAVWSGDIASNRFQIFGRLINAETGAVVGAGDFLIGEAAPTFNAFNPAVAYDAENGNYLVVWESSENVANDDTEVFGRIVNASGAPQGASSQGTAISTMGAAREAKDPDVCYNTATDSYLVVWSGDDSGTPLADGEFEIFARAVNASGTPTGSETLISQMGQLNVAAEGFAGANPAVACNNSGSGEYYVVWWGDDAANQDMEIYAQRLNASLAEVGVDDDKISLMGADAPGTDDGYRARFPDVAYNASDNRYLVVWEGGDTSSPAAGEGLEIYGQLINATDGTEVAPDDFKISEMGGSAGDVTRAARFPAVSYSSVSNEYVAVWEGDDDSGADDDFQIYASAVADDGTVDSANADVAISEATVAPRVVRATRNAGPAIAFGTSSAQYLATWEETVTGDAFEVRARGLTGSNTQAIIRLTETAITVAENAGTATVTVERTGNTSNAVTVDIATTPGTADLNDDFTDASATLSFASGDTEETVSISITDDGTAESNETINIALSNASAGATISTAAAVLTITDDDSDGGGSSGGGGGGCALSAKSGFDPVLLLLMLIAGGYLLSRRVVLH